VIFYTFELAKSLHARKRRNTFRCVRDAVAFKNKVYRIENGRISAFLAINAFAGAVEINDLVWICQIFLSALLHLSGMDGY